MRVQVSGLAVQKVVVAQCALKVPTLAITIEMYIMSEQNIHAYGTVEYYREYFADIIADVGTYDEIERNRVTMANVMGRLQASNPRMDGLSRHIRSFIS